MSANTYAITGIPPVQGVPPRPRRDISTWYNDPNSSKEVSLFIQALAIFQKIDPLTDPDREISYYRIAGIHGFPIKGWDGESNATGNLYCVHGSVTFPNWHRPFLLLFEQRLYEIMMKDIIPTIPSSEQATWTAAAQNWRLPYWDWAASYNEASLPVLLTSENITISKPGNKSESVHNPLVRFSNPSGLAMGDAKMRDLRIARFSIRQNVPFPAIPTNGGPINPSAPWIKGTNNSNAVHTAISNPQSDGAWSFQGSISDYVYRLLAPGNMSSWEAFASTENRDNGSSTDFMSVEDVHNYIHVAVGGENNVGHMSFPPVSAFDPIFWVHHCNIDRLTAMFQTLYPDKWFDSPVDGDPQPGDPLVPFHTDQAGTLWTSDDTKDWTRYNYTYDVLESPATPSAFTVLRTVPVNLPAVNPPAVGATHSHNTDKSRNLGGNNPHSSDKSHDLGSNNPKPASGSSGEHHQNPGSGENAPDNSVIAHLKQYINSKYGQTRQAVRDSPQIKGNDNDYIINVIYDPFALNGIPYTIQMYLSNPATSSQEKIPIGTVYTFTTPLDRFEDAEGRDEGGCVNCSKQAESNKTRTAQIPITRVLLEHAKDERMPLNSLEPQEVQEYLKKWLNWKVAHTCGTEIDITTMPKTRICVLQGKVEHTESDGELASFGHYKPMWDVTRGKAGGAASEEDMTGV